MNITDIILRLFTITIFSGIIGIEREKHNAHAGLRTHLFVGITATIIALIQQSVVYEIMEYHAASPNIGSLVRSDPTKLIAQVVSGIGFLGAGTIIVTKRNISGLTTATSIWSILGLGLAIGMGYFDIAIIGFVFLFSTLSFIKKIFSTNFEERVYIEYIGGAKTMVEIDAVFKKLELRSEHRSFKTKSFGDELIYASVFDVKGPKYVNFKSLVSEYRKSLILQVYS